MQHEITIKVCVDTNEGTIFKPSKAEMVSDLTERVEKLNIRGTRYRTVEVTSVTVDNTTFFGEEEPVADVSDMSIETAVGVLAKALIGTRAQQ